jgi:hypothetical protein
MKGQFTGFALARGEKIKKLWAFLSARLEYQSAKVGDEGVVRV